MATWCIRASIWRQIVSESLQWGIKFLCFATLSSFHPWAYKNLVGLGVQVLFEKNPNVMVRCGWEPLVWNSWARRHQVTSLNIGLLAIIWTIPLWRKYPLVDMIQSFATAHLVSLCLGFSAISFSPHSFPQITPSYPIWATFYIELLEYFQRLPCLWA